MDDSDALTNQEEKLVDEYLAKLEKNWRNWRSQRFVLLSASIIAMIFGIHCMRHYFEFLTNDYSVVDRLKEADPPEYPPPEYWFVGETRKTAAVLELNYKQQSLATIDGVMGLLCVVGSILGFVTLRTRWNNGKYYALLSKLLRIHRDRILHTN